MVNDLLKALSPLAQAINGRKDGVGHGLHIPFVLKCAGITQDDGSRVDQHVIGTITEAHDDGVDNIRFGNDNCNAVFEVDPSQTSFNPSNPVCFCGKGPML